MKWITREYFYESSAEFPCYATLALDTLFFFVSFFSFFILRYNKFETKHKAATLTPPQ